MLSSNYKVSLKCLNKITDLFIIRGYLHRYPLFLILIIINDYVDFQYEEILFMPRFVFLLNL